jgi:hypothetical protein
MSKKAVCYIVILICLFTNACLAKYSGGTGEPNDPYLIATPNDLNAIGADPNDWDKHFKMIADINLIGYPDGFVTPIGWGVDWASEDLPFTGVFDGNGHSVLGWKFTYDQGDEEYTGLFGYINEPNSEVRNLCLVAPQVSRVGWAGGFAGALVGYLESGSVYDCGVQDVNLNWMDSAGGLIGRNGGRITNCFASGDVSGEYEVAGLVGYNDYRGVISKCYAIVNVTSTATGSGGFVALNKGLISSSHCKGMVTGVSIVGGFAGSNSYGDIFKSFAIADVNGYIYVGGFIGKQGQGKIINCFAQGSVKGDRWVGGLIGRNLSGTYSGEASYTYTASRVEGTGTEIGGLVGEDYQGNGEFHASFWDINMSNDVNGIGNGSDPNVIGLPTAEMQRRSTFAEAGWDMVNVWDIGENQTYPFLRTHLPSDINKDDKTNFLDLAIQAAQWLDEK